MAPGRSSEALIIQGQPSGPPHRLADWLSKKGEPFSVHQVWQDGPLPPIAGRRFVAMLGSAHSVNQQQPEWIPQVKGLIGEAVERDVPVLGICFGAQALCVALGGTVAPMPQAEILWRDVDSDGGIVPPGPWIVWHYEAFTVPPDAEELARSELGPLAFRHGPHLGVQFHAETTPDGSEVWMQEERDDLARWGVDTEALRRHGRELEPQAGAATERLFDGWWKECVHG